MSRITLTKRHNRFEYTFPGELVDIFPQGAYNNRIEELNKELNSHRRFFGRRYSTPLIILLIGMGLVAFGIVGGSKLNESMSSQAFYSVLIVWGVIIICGVIVWICRRNSEVDYSRILNSFNDQDSATNIQWTYDADHKTIVLILGNSNQMSESTVVNITSNNNLNGPDNVNSNAVNSTIVPPSPPTPTYNSSRSKRVNFDISTT
ncbi:8767_t:CDS:2 [Paraglomus brasilianum]|uniref:8767_t:CDS:1 n=1 Tax=Paraglomus brasilianum TaxID=144538 RepID=A0A9N9CZS5_9GLOM|nr:8767_t:CDS:2 [Paraglomus brasilianum]